MVGAIAGDIIRSRFEGEVGPPRDFALFHPDCRFTDDTVCTVAVADALMGSRDFATTIRAFVRRHPDLGYGGMFLDWALTDDAPAYGSWGNGAPMRMCDELLVIARLNNFPTHEERLKAFAKPKAARLSGEWEGG